MSYYDELHATKYRQPGESFEEAMARVAKACAHGEAHEKALFDSLVDRRWLPAGRIQRGMGVDHQKVTPFNCFVSGTIEDSMTGIMAKAGEAALTLRMGGGIGYDFSTLRPRGSLIKSLGSESTGPVSFMHVFNALGKCISSSGHRRGAQMAIMRVDHPDVREFVRSKQNTDQMNSFNISVAVTDEFMRNVKEGLEQPLRFNGEVVGSTDARALWDEIMESTWRWAEPGVIFLDVINSHNNLWYCEDIAATNPCSEQPLPPYGACLLSSVNLTRYLTAAGSVNYGLLTTDVGNIVRALDNVIERANYPLPQQRLEAHSKRRMGIGVTGVANALESLGFPYGSEGYLKVQDEILHTVARTAYLASCELAAERGEFPLLNRKAFLRGEFVQGLDADIRSRILARGIRNSHLLSIAPTGTISMAAGNVSSGIEPVYDYEVSRYVDGQQVVLDDYGVRELKTLGRTAARDVTVGEHLAVLSRAQKFVDSSVSKTVNVSASTTFDEFKSIYADAYYSGCKGVSTFRASGDRAPLICASGKCDL